MSESPTHLPPDHAARQGILTRLDTSLVVEASAGTGKTTSMVGRMIALLEQGKCEVSRLAAVTFTRKAAAELRSRFQARLERAMSNPPATGITEIQRQRLSAALHGIESCSISTIHSFCAKLLRERPIEAGVDPAFQVLEPDVDETLREEAWRDHIAGLHARDDPLIDELIEVGLEPGQLRDAFDRFAVSTDVEWPLGEIPELDPAPAMAALRGYLDRLSSLLPHLPEASGSDRLIPRIRNLARRARHVDWSNLADLMSLFDRCTEIESGADDKRVFTIKHWPGKSQDERKERAEAELQRWNSLAALHVAPALRIWRARRYAVVHRLLEAGLTVYEQKKREAGGLSQQDLLVKAAALLRRSALLREYFQKRFTHLLVDELQDTDPVQAEVMLLLTSRDVEESDWRKTRPRPGSLFVVGDPKQSIYRFRRADISTYNRVKEIIVASGGDIVTLTANFRSDKPILDWVNDSFRNVLGEAATEYQPAYSPLEPGRAGTAQPDRARLRRFDIPSEIGKNEEIVRYEAHALAAQIADELSRGARPEDFLIITYKKKTLTTYAEALQSLRIPVRITGGNVLSSVEEVALLRTVLRAITEPQDPVALVAVLRGEAFGISDTALYAFRKHRGELSYFSEIPVSLAESHCEAFEALTDAFARLRLHASWLRTLPPVTAFQRIAQDLGLFARAAAGNGGNVKAGSLAKAFEVLREAGKSLHSATDLVEHLEVMLAKGSEIESMPALPERAPGVRLMNLHKVKGLEAPVVFLADPTGRDPRERGPQFHVRRDQGIGHASMCVCETREEGLFVAAKVLAAPLDWEAQAEEEKKFIEAEQGRLLYVAGTRAGRQLTVTFRANRKSSSYWSRLEDFAGDFEPLVLSKEALPGERQRRSLKESELDSFCEASSSRWAAVQNASYEVKAAKTWAVTHLARGGAGSGEGDSSGAAWGTVIHGLLEAAMRSASADLLVLARARLDEAELPLDRAEEAVDVVRGVQSSEIWRRALAAERVLTEVPFEHLLDESQSAAGPPTLVRGVIDLVFKEARGWVIVDYKTDAGARSDTKALTEQYRGQIAAYSRAWSLLAGEAPVESGIYFTAAKKHVIVAG